MVGATSRRLRTVFSIRPGSGLPSSMYSVPPWLSTRPRLWLLPAVWFQGSQSTSTGGGLAQRGQRVRQHLLVAAEHALRVDHRLGLSGRAGGEQEFGDRVRADGRVRRVHVRGWLSSLPAQRTGRRARLPCPREPPPQSLSRSARRPQRRPARASSRPMTCFSLREVGGYQRVGRGHRHVGDADVHAGKREQGVLDVVVRKDRQRALRGQTALEQRLADRAHARDGRRA